MPKVSGAAGEYSSKRHFDRTPEPRPGTGVRQAADRFVVHRHDARRLHYDLRLSDGEKLCSWAVPNGFSYNPGTKRLAVRTEDHPLEYLEFRGMIPKGEYGAGTIDIWDSGTYRLVKDERIERALEKGELKLRLYGKRLRGEWHMVKTKSGDWLLFKAKDPFARDSDSLLPASIDPDRLVEEELPLQITPMSAAEAAPPFSDPDWLFEIEFEGWRVLAGKDGGRPVLRGGGRAGTPAASAALEALGRQLRRLGCDTVLLDAVLVALDESGRPSQRALEEAWEEDPDSIAVYAFDLLNWEGYSTRELTLLERKALLRSLLPPSGAVLYVDSVAERGQILAAEAARLGLDTLVAKKADSRYAAGASKQWKRIHLSGSQAGGEGKSLPAQEAQRKARFKLSNPGKVLWPAEGYTKKELFGYYEAVAEHLLPHLRGRPMHMHRFPNGIEEKSFYQKRPPESFPSWIAQVEFPETEERYLLCNDRPTLLYLANLASIDLHPWLSRADNPECPDWAVIDIDAKESSFETAVKIARKAGSLLRGLGVRSFVKTSGGSGLHVYVPLAASYSYEQSRMFAETVARVLAMENRDSATVERNPQKRSGKVYVDFLQNRRGQTVVPPYSARPVPKARVSMPLEWDELRRGLSPDRFTIKTAVERLDELGDLFRPVLELDQDLLPAIEALSQYMEEGGRAASE